jgi:hypothetical protein
VAFRLCLLYNKYNMILNEIYSRSPAAYQDVSQDNSQPQLNNLRKTRLTLRQINKLRQMNDVRSYEYKEKLKQVKKQYAPPPAAPAL